MSNETVASERSALLRELRQHRSGSLDYPEHTTIPGWLAYRIEDALVDAELQSSMREVPTSETYLAAIASLTAENRALREEAVFVSSDKKLLSVRDEEISSLRAEVERLQGAKTKTDIGQWRPAGLCSACREAKQIISQLTAEVERLKKDSERLEWLYSGKHTRGNALLTIETDALIGNGYPSMDEVRLAIDEDIAAQEEAER